MDPNFEQQIPIVLIVIGFLVLMILRHFMRAKLRKRHLKQEGQISTEGGRIPSIEERVAGNPAWARGQIQSKGRLFMPGMWLLAVVWNLTFGASFIMQLSNPAIPTGGLIMLGIFAFAGLGAIAFAVRVTIRHLRYGESICRISGKAGVLGKVMKGTIHTKSEIRPEGDYTVMLQCVEIYWVGRGKNRTSKVEIHWQGKQAVAGMGTSSRAGIPFTFDIPKFPPETGYQLARGQINWQLTVTAPTKGVDYSALFVVPVFKLD